MRNLIAALAVGVAGVGFAVSAQAAPSTNLVPLTPLSQSSIPVAEYGYGHNRCYRVKVCHGYGHHRECHWENRCRH